MSSTLCLLSPNPPAGGMCGRTGADADLSLVRPRGGGFEPCATTTLVLLLFFLMTTLVPLILLRWQQRRPTIRIERREAVHHPHREKNVGMEVEEGSVEGDEADGERELRGRRCPARWEQRGRGRQLPAGEETAVAAWLRLSQNERIKMSTRGG
jgi:hypothetical protein